MRHQRRLRTHLHDASCNKTQSTCSCNSYRLPTFIALEAVKITRSRTIMRQPQNPVHNPALAVCSSVAPLRRAFLHTHPAVRQTQSRWSSCLQHPTRRYSGRIEYCRPSAARGHQRHRCFRLCWVRLRQVAISYQQETWIKGESCTIRERDGGRHIYV